MTRGACEGAPCFFVKLEGVTIGPRVWDVTRIKRRARELANEAEVG